MRASDVARFAVSSAVTREKRQSVSPYCGAVGFFFENGFALRKCVLFKDQLFGMRYDVPNVMETFHLYFLCASGLIATSIGSPIAGPYLINSEFVKTCEGRETTSYWQSRVKLSKFNAKEPVVFQTLSGNTTITHDVDDTFWGLYIHDNAPLNMSFPNFPILPYGYYRIEMNMGLDADQKRDL
ncbi:tRNA-dihydrouridine synthase B, partial [Frankliniella fusca]